MSSLKFSSLGSGSRGNGTLVQSDTTTILIDCGWSRRETVNRLNRLNTQPDHIDALLVTHRHGDHARGVDVVARGFTIPVYASEGTMYGHRGESLFKDTDFCPLKAGENVFIGDIEIHPVKVPHDCVEPLQFVFEHDGYRLGVLTDIGHITTEVRTAYENCDTLFVESNHDLDMLWHGTYPANVKRRIAGDFGHLNNEQTLDFILSVNNERLRHVVVGHISQENNSMGILEGLYSQLRGMIEVDFATQDSGVDWFKVGAFQ